MKANRLPAFKALITLSLLFVPLVFFQISPNIILYLGAGILLLFLALFIQKKNSLAFYFGCFLIATILSYNVNSNTYRYDEKIVRDCRAGFQGEVEKVLKSSDKYIRVLAKGRLDTKQLPAIQNQRLLLSILSKDSIRLKITAGSKIYAPVKVHLPRTPQFPDEFNESQYASSLNCNWIATATSSNIAILGLSKNIYYCQYQCSNFINKIIAQYYKQPALSVIEALLTGTKTNIPPSVRQEFSRAGTAHVLAVSGLHTGLVAAFIFVILGFISNHTIKFILFCLLLDAFIFLSGFQPSAIRAALMSELYLFAILIGRKVEPLNIASFVLLMYILVYPSIIQNIAFQMSALSILGILILFPAIKRFWDLFAISDKMPAYIKNSLSLTIAASTAVSPLVAYYFGVYSIISPLTNLLVLPLFILILAFGFFSVIFAFIPFIAELYAIAASTIIHIANAINHFATSIPYSFIENDAVFFVAISICILTIYIIFSNTIRVAAFRLFAGSIVAILLYFFLIPIRQNNDLKIYPRQQYVLIDVPAYQGKKLIMIIDRKHNKYAFRDMAAEQYIENLYENQYNNAQDSLLIAYNGAAGQKIMDNIAENIKFNKIDIDLQSQLIIEQKLNIKKHFVQIIKR